jgi:uncharacterized protein YdeI (YjbR/CyaY-like superfamily)
MKHKSTKPKIVHFASREDFREWLAGNHSTCTELFVAFYKKHTGKCGATYDEAVEEALCYGWIDGVKKRLDDEKFMHRFSPRSAKSTWSKINVRRAMTLIETGKMAPPGLKAFEAREVQRAGIYTYELEHRGLRPVDKKRFMKNAKAWKFFANQPPGYQRTAGSWVSTAKQEETRLRRLARLIKDSEHHRRLNTLSPKVNN